MMVYDSVLLYLVKYCNVVAVEYMNGRIEDVEGD